MRYFTTEDIGPKRKLTPDGFLICIGVPFARTGRMTYSKRDLPKYEAGPDGHTILVDRFPDELFNPDAMSSFEGMPLTDDHPPGYMMSPKVFRQHAVGHMQNIRPGAAEGMPDCLLADLFVSDQDMIAKVLAGKVQVSAGYDAQYRKISPGVYEQYKIVGNHTAFVAAGRCGPRCSVGDSAAETQCGCASQEACTCTLTPKRGSFMATKSQLKKYLDDVQKTVDEMTETNTEGGTHVHVHMPGDKDMVATGDKRTKDGENVVVAGKEGAAPPDTTGSTDQRAMDKKTMDDALTSIQGRLETLEDILSESSTDERLKDARTRVADKRMKDKKTRDDFETKEEKEAREEREKKDKETNDRRMRDGDTEEKDRKDLPAKTTDSASNSAYFEPEFTQALQLAAILSPGLATPTFDSAAHFATTAASLCNLRRSSLRFALGQQNTKDAVVELGVDSTATLDAMPCAAVKIAFLGAAGMVRQRNNGLVGGVLGKPLSITAPATKGVRTAAEINAANAARWAK